MWKRNDVTGKWDARECLEPPKPDFVPKPASSIPLTIPNELGAEIMRSLVMVNFNVPYVIDGGFSDSYIGVGTLFTSHNKEGIPCEFSCCIFQAKFEEFGLKNAARKLVWISSSIATFLPR